MTSDVRQRARANQRSQITNQNPPQSNVAVSLCDHARRQRAYGHGCGAARVLCATSSSARESSAKRVARRRCGAPRANAFALGGDDATNVKHIVELGTPRARLASPSTRARDDRSRASDASPEKVSTRARRASSVVRASSAAARGGVCARGAL